MGTSNKMFSLAFIDDRDASVSLDSVSHDSQTLKNRVKNVFEHEKTLGDICENAELTEHVDPGDSSVTTYSYDDENNEYVLYAQIGHVDIL